MNENVDLRIWLRTSTVTVLSIFCDSSLDLLKLVPGLYTVFLINVINSLLRKTVAPVNNCCGRPALIRD
jgi:hypothetical protein